jgi:AcrR family transcriptional regulator
MEKKYCGREYRHEKLDDHPIVSEEPPRRSQCFDAHRHAVRSAILQTTWTLVTTRGLSAVTMALIAQQTGIGRATLYKYFSDVESILQAWHDDHVRDHLEHLRQVRDESDPDGRLEAALGAYALIVHERGQHGMDLMQLLHRGEHVERAQRQLHTFFRNLLNERVRKREVRSDISSEELTRYCLHALAAAGSLPSKAAVRRAW